MGTKYTAGVFIEAIQASGGIIATVLNNVGCSYETFKRYRDKHPSVAAEWESALIAQLGKARSVIANNIDIALRDQKKEGAEQQESGDAKWLLSRLGKKYGYGSDPEVQVVTNITTLADFRRSAAERLKQVEQLEE